MQWKCNGNVIEMQWICNRHVIEWNRNAIECNKNARIKYWKVVEQISSYISRNDVFKTGGILSKGFRMGPCRLFLKELEPEHFEQHCISPSLWVTNKGIP